MRPMVISGIRPSFPGLSRSARQITHVLLTRSPLVYPKALPLDLHVLSTPPAFVLSQDQTLQQKLAIQLSPAPRDGTRRTQSNIKLAQHHQSEHKARHTVEFSKDTRTPSPCRERQAIGASCS